MKLNKKKNKVAIIMGSQSDHPIMKDCEKILKILKVKFQVLIVSAHRTPKRMFDFAEKAEKNGFGVIVAGAGGAAHLAGMVASLTTLPVLGVPMETKKLNLAYNAILSFWGIGFFTLNKITLPICYYFFSNWMLPFESF